MLSGINTAESISMMRLDAILGKRKKGKVLGQGGLGSTLFNNINKSRYANGTNPIWGQNPENLYPAGYDENGMPVDENGMPMDGDNGNTQVGSPNEGAFKPVEEPKAEKKEDKKTEDKQDPEQMVSDGTSSASKAQARGDDCEKQTDGVRMDASVEASKKKASIENQKKVEENVKKLEKDEKKYEKDLNNTKKRVETEQKKVDENAERMEELQTRAENLQADEAEENAESNKEQIANVAQEMKTITDDTKNRTSGLDKDLSNQKSLRKKAMDGSKKMEQAFGKMTSIGVDYQGANDKVHDTAEKVETASDIVSTVGEVTSDVGGVVNKYGIAEEAAGEILAATGYGAVAGAAMIAMGKYIQGVGTTVGKIGDIVHYTGDAGVAAAKFTQNRAEDSRVSIDSFTDTSVSAQEFGDDVTKYIKGTSENIAMLAKDNKGIKTQLKTFQTMTQKVAAMGGGGLAKAMGGGGQSGNTVGAANPYADMMSRNDNNLFASAGNNDNPFTNSGSESNYDNLFAVNNKRKNLFA